MGRSNRLLHIAALCCFLVSTAWPQQPDAARRRQIQVHLRNAQEALKENHPDAAALEFQAVLQIDPKQVEARASLGMIAFLGQDFPKAIELFREVIKLQPTLWRAHALLGISLRRTGDLKSSRAALEKAFPNLAGDPKLKIKAGMELVDLHYQTGELDRAAALLGQLQRAYPADVDILYAAYHTYAKLAELALESMAAAGPQSARLHQVIAQRRANAGDVKGAIEHYSKALEADPQLPGVHFEFGQALLLDTGSEDSLGRARKEFEAALASSPDDPNAQRQLGEVFLRMSDNQSAAAHFSRALELRPNDAEAHFGIGKVYVASGDLKKAAAHLENAIRLDGENALAHYRLGNVYQRLGRSAEADREIARFQELRSAQRAAANLARELGLPPKRPASEEAQP